MGQTGDWTALESPDMADRRPKLQLLRVMWHRKWLVLSVTAVALALGYLYLVKAQPVYQSKAQVLLIKKEAKFPADAAEGQRDPGGYGGYEDELSTHIILIRSPKIVGRAVENHHLASVLPSLKHSSNPVATIIAGLTATPARSDRRARPDPNVIDLQYQGGHPRDSQTILAAVITSYEGFLAETYKDFSGETFNLIEQAKDVLGKQLRDNEKKYREFRQSSPLLWQGDQSANLHETRMAEIEQARSELLVEITQTKARIKTIEDALAEGGNREALALLIANSGATTTTTPDAPQMARSAFEDELFRTLLEEQQLLENFGPDHPKVKALRKRMNLMREHLGGAPLSEDAEPADFLPAYVESLHQELEEQEGTLNELNELFEQERTSSKELTDSQIKDESLSKEISRTQRIFDAVVKRLEEINLIKDYGGITTEVVSEASYGSQIWPSLPMILGPFLILGLAAGFGLACVVELADRRFRTPDDVYKQLGLPLIGHIPVIDVRKSRRSRVDRKTGVKAPLDPILCSFYQPRSAQAESYRAVRTSLYFSARGEDHKVIQVTSPNPGDGKTTLASNLAVSIANSGKRVLLLDADFRHPKIHKYFGLDDSVGLSSVISEKDEVSEAIQETAVANLWAMACGPRPQNPADVLTSTRLTELLAMLREKYDFIIIDSPPLLAVTDPSVVAPRVDAVALVIRLTKSARHDATQAAEMLSALGAQPLGIVVNGVGRRHGRYGYNYRYSGYRYGGYRYGTYRYDGSRYGDGRGDGSGDGLYDSSERSAERPVVKTPETRRRLKPDR